MNRRKIYKFIIKLFAFFALNTALSVIAYQYIYFPVKHRFVPGSVIVKFSRIYSDKESQNIQNFINQNFDPTDYSNFNPGKFCKNLRNKFKFIKKVSWKWDDFNQAVFHIDLVRPAFCINNTFLLGDKKRLFPINVFYDNTSDNHLPYSLKHVGVGISLIKEKIDKKVYKFINRVPKDYWERFYINYESKNKISLKEKTAGSVGDNNCIFVVDKNVFFNRGSINIPEVIHEDFMDKKGRRLTKLSKNICATYDLRFKNRIYAKIAKSKGG